MTLTERDAAYAALAAAYLDARCAALAARDAAHAAALTAVFRDNSNATMGATKMNIASILSAACADAGLDPLAWASISAADLIAARAGREAATPASVSPEAQIAYERGLRLAAETRVAVLEELLAMQGERDDFAGEGDAETEPGEFVDDDARDAAAASEVGS